MITMTLAISEGILRAINQTIANTAYEEELVLKVSKAFGNHVTIPAWKSDYSEWVYEPQLGGYLSFNGTENAPDVDPRISEKTAILMTLSGTLNLSTATIAQMEQNALGIQDTLMTRVRAQMGKMKQVQDTTLWCGQAGRYLDAADPLKRATTDGNYLVRGLLFDSNIQTIAGGIGADDDMQAFGDFYATCVLADKTAKVQGVDTSQCLAVMDTTTYQYMLNSLSTNIWEWNQIEQGFPNWKFMANNNFLANGLTSNSYMVFLFPRQTNGEPTFKTVSSVDARARSLGGLSSKDMVPISVEEKSGVIIKNGYGIIKTGALTLTAE